jgi:hypothetical protein
LSIIFLVAFDIFIFVNLLDGLESQRNNISSPYTKYNSQCIDAFDDEKKFGYSDFITIKKHKEFYGNRLNRNAPFYSDSFRQPDTDTFCIELHDYIVAAQNDGQFVSYLSQLESILRSKESYEQQKRTYEREYKEFREDYGV